MSKVDIFITGGNSFISQTIIPELSNKYSIFSPTHNQIDITNQLDLYELFSKSNFKVVIHTASKGGRRNNEDNPEYFYNNLLMLNNLLEYQSKYNFKLIVFSSGAEYDRRGNIFNEKEGNFNSIPIDYYGLSKFIQTKIIKNRNNIFNLRLFNVFSEIGQQDSFIYSCINRALNNENINIFEDKFFSFFYGKDLALLIDYLINEDFMLYEEFNVTYNDASKLSDIARLIVKLTNSKSKVIIENKLGKSYCGNGEKLGKLNLKFTGILNGINNCIKYQNEYKNKI